MQPMDENEKRENGGGRYRDFSNKFLILSSPSRGISSWNKKKKKKKESQRDYYISRGESRGASSAN